MKHLVSGDIPAKRTAAMSSLGDASSEPAHYPSSVTSQSSSINSRCSLTMAISPTNIRIFQGLAEMRRTLDKLDKSIQADYLAFERVKKDNLEMIDKNLKRKVRITYYENHELLIVKYMPSPGHQYIIRELDCSIDLKIRSMGIRRTAFMPVGSCRFYGVNSCKEADLAWIHLPARIADGQWPPLVAEVGLSEFLPQLRRDVRWWLIESEGDVGIALLASIGKESSSILIEKWELGPAPLIRSGPVTRASASNSVGEPVCMQIIEVTRTGTTGGSLILEFDKIFLRPPNPPENDLIFSVEELEEMVQLSLNLH